MPEAVTYNQSYFTSGNPAGYTEYGRWFRYEGEGSTGEYYRDLMTGYVNNLQLSGKSVLELGCAYGFLVEDGRNLGVNIWGMDISAWAISQASSAIQPYLIVADARTGLSGYKSNEWNVIISRQFLECIPEADLPDLITEMNRVSQTQVHIITTDPNPTYYLVHPLTWWQGLGFEVGTRLIDVKTGEMVSA